MSYIQPLQLETWFINVFSGTPTIFLGVSLLIISTLAMFFRMTPLAFFFIIGVFLLMFSEFVASPLVILIIVFSGLIIGYVLSKVFSG